MTDGFQDTGGASLPPARTWLPLLQEALEREGCFRWRLRGASMQPTLPGGSEIEIRPLPTRLRCGDLIVFCAGDCLVAHRLVRRWPGSLITQGDGCPAADPPWERSHALGIVRAAYWQGQRCWPGSWEFAGRPYWVLRHYLLLLWRRLRPYPRRPARA